MPTRRGTSPVGGVLAHTRRVADPHQPPTTPQPPAAAAWDAWGAGPEPRWGSPAGPTASSWSARALLPGLAVAAAAVALAASFLPYFRVSFGNGVAVFAIDGWQQQITTGGTPSGATFLPQGVVLAAACAVLAVGAVAALLGPSRPVGLGLQVLGAGMAVSYGALQLSQALLSGGQFDRASVGVGGWLLGAAGLACLVVTALSLRELAATVRRAGSELGTGCPQVGEDDAGGTLLQPGQPG
jgi:hypothetical protein